MKKTFLMTLATILVLGAMLFSTVAYAAPPVSRPYDILACTLEGGGPPTVDPAWCYDTAAAWLLTHVYDQFLRFDGEQTGNYLPNLCLTNYVIEELPAGTTSPEGRTWTFRYTFEVKTGVQFHDGSIMTPADIEFSIERGMIQDRAGGPQWMYYEPLFSTPESLAWGLQWFSVDEGGPFDFTVTEDVQLMGKILDHAVESNSTHVWLNLEFPGAYAPLLQILCQNWASVLSKNWINTVVIGQEGRPDWNGEWGDYSGWYAFHNPDISPLDDPSPLMMGTGCYIFEDLDPATQWSAVRFEDYHEGWPASWPKLGSAKPAGYVDRIVVTWAFTWETRSTMFLAGDCDFCTVPREYRDVVLNQPGIRCIYPLPALSCDAQMYSYNLVETTPYGTMLPAGTFDETGIPTDFFGNPEWGIHNRKGFSYALDMDTYLAEAWLGEAIHPPTVIVAGLPGYDPNIPGAITFDLAKAEAEFRAVPGLWDTGFTVMLLYNTGNIPRQRSAELTKAGVEGLNPKFHVEIAPLEWRTILRAFVRGQTPLCTIGWLADYPDPHNFVQPYYHSGGVFASFQQYANPEMDALINAGINEADPAERIKIYRDVAIFAVEDCPNLALQQGVGRHFQREWINGYYYNPIYPALFFYNMWKHHYVPHSNAAGPNVPPISTYLPVDVNYDGQVNIVDITVIAQAFGASYGPPLHPRWQFRADIDNNRVVNIIDIAVVAKYFRQTSSTWTAPA